MRTQRQIIEDLNFASDARNCDRFDDAPVLYTCDEAGNTVEKPLPTKWAVCSVCNGAGSHVNPSIDCNGLSAEDFAEDPDFADDYMAGTYDVPCNRCGGRTTERVVDLDALTPEELAAFEDQQRDEARDRAEHLAEIRAGA